MGGEGPYAEFETNHRLWQPPKELKVLEEEDVSAAYVRAHKYFLDRVALLKEAGWKDVNVNVEESLVHVEHELEGEFRKHLLRVHLPCAFKDLLDVSKPTCGGQVFVGASSTFDARRKNRSSDLYIEASQPVADIFYMVQCIAPGMLTIIRIDEIDDYGEQKIIRKLPRTSWIEENKEALVDILGEDIFISFVEVSTRSAVEVENDPYMVNRDYEEDLVMDRYGNMQPRDYTACSIECGYCGACDY